MIPLFLQAGHGLGRHKDTILYPDLVALNQLSFVASIVAFIGGLGLLKIAIGLELMKFKSNSWKWYSIILWSLIGKTNSVNAVTLHDSTLHYVSNYSYHIFRTSIYLLIHLHGLDDIFPNVQADGTLLGPRTPRDLLLNQPVCETWTHQHRYVPRIHPFDLLQIPKKSRIEVNWLIFGRI